MDKNSTCGLASSNVVRHLVKVLGEIHGRKIVLLDVLVGKEIWECWGRLLRLD